MGLIINCWRLGGELGFIMGEVIIGVIIIMGKYFYFLGSERVGDSGSMVGSY
jgi:hypothetical protein